MELNTQIWGDSTEWQVDETINYYNDSKKAYNGKYKSISDYVTNNIFELNTAIDNTILYCGQAAGVTPWGDRAIYSGFGSIEGTTPTPTLEINRQADIALFTVQNNTSHFRGIDGIRAIMDESTNPDSLTNTGYTRWSPHARNFPDAEFPNTNLPNTNYQLCPIVDFDLRCMIGVIYVNVCSTIDGTRTTMTLYDFEHGNYSNYVILYAFMRLALLSRTDEYSIAQTSSPARAIGFVDMRPIETATGDYINYAESVQNIASIPLFGFNEDRYEWSSTYLCFDTYWGYNNRDTEDTNSMSHAGVLYSASRATFVHYEIQKDYQTYRGLYSLWYYMENNADNLEYLRKAAASYGIWFTDNPTNNILQSPNRWTDSNMMLGLLRDGVGYGDYTRGTENTTNPAYNWTSSHESGYDPSKNVDPNTYSDTTNFNTLSLKQAFTRRYALTSTEVQALAGKLWDANATKDPDITMNDFALDEYLTNNPIDCIVSLKYFPCSFFTQSALPITPLYLGKYDTGMAVYAVDKEIRVLDFAPIMIFRHFGDFRDFEPYTQLQMYIPFCGTVSIPCAEAMGKYVSVKLVIDVSTGACSGFVLVSNSGTGGICVATATGTAAIDLPVSGLQSANLSQAIFNATANWTQTQITNGKIGGGILAQSDNFIGTMARGYSKTLGTGVANSAVSLARGNLSAGVGILSALDPTKALETGLLLDLENARAKYDLTHVEMPMRLIGSASPILSAVLETVCRLIIYRPRTDDNALASYANTVGYACCKSGVVSDFSGFTVGTIDVSGINATQDEKAAIAAAFASGVYL